MTVTPVDWTEVCDWADGLASTIASQHAHQYIGIVIRDDEADDLRVAGQRVGASVDQDVLVSGETHIPLDGSICGRVFRTGVPALVSDVRMDPDYGPFLGTPMRSELAVPIRVGDRIVGVVNLESPLISAFDIVDLDDIMARIGEAAAGFPTGVRQPPETA
jgi:putative methionine-R-sulfoxide reductase with GAF domain